MKLLPNFMAGYKNLTIRTVNFLNNLKTVALAIVLGCFFSCYQEDDIDGEGGIAQKEKRIVGTWKLETDTQRSLTSCNKNSTISFDNYGQYLEEFYVTDDFEEDCLYQGKIGEWFFPNKGELHIVKGTQEERFDVGFYHQNKLKMVVLTEDLYYTRTYTRKK